jgi:uncharacterized protein (UPF0332 family)
MEGSIRELSKYRFECCQEALEDAYIMFEAGRYKNTLNRSYYAIFYAIRSVNALQGFDSGKHSGVIAFFNQNYVKTGIFPKGVSKIIKEASEKRERADYLDFYIASKEDARLQIERAIEFKEIVKDYLKKCDIL